MGSIETVDKLVNASSPTERLHLFAAAVLLAGMAGVVGTLALEELSIVESSRRMGGASALALIFIGLFAGGWRWRRAVRRATVQRESAVRLNRFHTVMSQTNRLILRRPNPYELLEGVCAICVDAGQMDLVLVDMTDVGEAHRATARASAVESSPASAELLLEGARLQTLMLTLALAASEKIVVDDASTDERLREARVWCLATGLHSLAAVPLKRAGKPVGILLLCSRTKSFFEGQVALLLGELGDDLSFAIDNADRERERKSALKADHARAIADEANRAKTEFLALMSHEIRTPLNAMLGFAQLLATDTVQVLSTTQAERVRLITHAGWHLLGLVNDVMDISCIESGRLVVVNVRGDISSVLNEAVALTQPLAREHRVELAECPTSRNGIGAVADPRRLLQVLLNLLSNACKYNRPGGQVRVEVTHEDTDVILDVVDNGVGMTNEQLSHLFEPFNRLGNVGAAIEGTGIGLALARRLVEKMNGRLEIASDPGAGTRARLVLPSCAIPLTSPGRELSVESQQSRGSRVNPTPVAADHLAVILYIEDDPVNRILVEQMLLRCAGVQLLLAQCGEDGIALARIRQPNLVLLDMHLPDMSGLDVLSALRADPDTCALQVVAVSANAVGADIERARALGAVDYWTKPLNLDAFLAGISNLLNTRVRQGTQALV